MNIVIKLDADDRYDLVKEHKVFGINDPEDYKYTFWNEQLEHLPEFPSGRAIDLLMISLAVYKADRSIKRADASNNWERAIHLHVPVLNVDLFEDNKGLLTEIMGFLTGDRWIFTFRKREFIRKENFFKVKMNQVKFVGFEKINKICMLSGGLDSFIGAIDLLEGGCLDTIFVSIYGGGKGTREYQNSLRKKLVDKYAIPKSNFYSFYVAPRGAKENTMRSRSFMFLSHAIALASCFRGKMEIFIPENGYISLNIPLTFSRIGTSSTRTTHPHYMSLFKKLLDALGMEVNFINPYQFKTKGEMISECKNKEFLFANIVNTMSCSHPDSGRMKGEKQARHCGTCYPCLIRRASIRKAGITDDTKYRDPNFTKGDTARKNLNSYLLGLEKYKPEKAFLSIQMSGAINSNIERYESTYKRGIVELEELLKDYYES